MIKPTSKDVQVFENYSTNDFENWLKKGIEKYELEDDVWGFEPVALFINQNDHWTLDLSNIYDVLPSNQKIDFYKALDNLTKNYKGDKNILENMKILKENIEGLKK